MMQAHAVTYSPYTKTVYRGSLEDMDFNHARNYEPIATIDPSKGIDDDGRIEFVNHEMVRTAERHQRDAVLDSLEIANITATDMVQRVIGTEWRNFNARLAIDTIAVPKLILDLPYRNAKMAASKKVGELNAPTVTNTEFSKATFALWKNVANIYASDEARFRGTIEPLNYDINQTAGALGSAANDQIVIAIEGATTASKGDWGAKTSGVSDRDPAEDIMTEMAVIQNLHYNPRFLTMNPRVWADYIANTNVKGTAVPIIDRNTMGSFMLPGFPGLLAVVDAGFTNTVATLVDPSTILLGEGPTVAENYRDYQRGADGYVIRQWLQPLLITADGSRKMTGVSA